MAERLDAACAEDGVQRKVVLERLVTDYLDRPTPDVAMNALRARWRMRADEHAAAAEACRAALERATEESDCASLTIRMERQEVQATFWRALALEPGDGSGVVQTAAMMRDLWTKVWEDLKEQQP